MAAYKIDNKVNIKYSIAIPNLSSPVWNSAAKNYRFHNYVDKLSTIDISGM